MICTIEVCEKGSFIGWPVINYIQRQGPWALENDFQGIYLVVLPQTLQPLADLLSVPRLLGVWLENRLVQPVARRSQFER